MRRSLITMASVVGLAATALAGASTAHATTNDPFYGKLWGLQQIHAEQAWSKTTGVGSIVAVVDTGIDFTQPDPQGQILQGATFTGCAAVAPCGNGDFRGPDGVNNGDEHGTHVAGTIAAVRGNGIAMSVSRRVPRSCRSRSLRRAPAPARTSRRGSVGQRITVPTSST